MIRDHSTDSVGVRCDLELLTRMPSPLPMGDDCDSIDIVSLQTLVDCPTRWSLWYWYSDTLKQIFNWRTKLLAALADERDLRKCKSLTCLASNACTLHCSACTLIWQAATRFLFSHWRQRREVSSVKVEQWHWLANRSTLSWCYFKCRGWIWRRLSPQPLSSGHICVIWLNPGSRTVTPYTCWNRP